MRRARKSKIRKKALILIAVVAAIAVIVVSAMRNQNLQSGQGSPKPLASEYFKVEHTVSFGEFYYNNRTVYIHILGLRVTALGGDAHSIYIWVEGAKEPYYIKNITAGHCEDVEIELSGYYTGRIEYDSKYVYPVELTISCPEVESETITIYLEPDDIKGPHH
jgi:uncharacterized protein YpmB